MNEEKPLGNLIIDLCDDKDNKCEICGETKYKHSYLLYNKQGRIIISILNKNDENDKAEKLLREMISRGLL